MHRVLQDTTQRQNTFSISARGSSRRSCSVANIKPCGGLIPNLVLNASIFTGLLSDHRARMGYPYFDCFLPASKSSFPTPLGSWTSPGARGLDVSITQLQAVGLDVTCYEETYVIAETGAVSYSHSLFTVSLNLYFLYS